MSEIKETNFKEIYEKLLEPFDPNDLEWRAGSFSEKTNKALAFAYVDARAVMKRLDDVIGPENWMDSYEAVAGDGGKRGFICTLYLKINGEWISKQDGADETDFEAIKGGLSDAFKRAANKWGVGRYLYSLPETWTPAEKFGKVVKITSKPQLPLWALPQSMQNHKEPIKKATKPTVAKKVSKELEEALKLVIPAGIGVPFEGKTLGEAYADDSVGMYVVRFLTGDYENKNSVKFTPTDSVGKTLQEAAKLILKG